MASPAIRSNAGHPLGTPQPGGWLWRPVPEAPAGPAAQPMTAGSGAPRPFVDTGVGSTSSAMSGLLPAIQA